MPVAAIIGAAGAIGGALISSHGANSAAKTQANAADQAAQTQMKMYQQTRGDLAPFMSTGSSAMSQLANLFGFGPGGSGMPNGQAMTSALTATPGYQFGLNQGVQALDRSAASRGLTLSGAQLQDTQKFGTGYAMQTAWQPYVSALQSAASLGENAAAGAGNAGTAAAAGAAQSQLAAGQATASGQVATSNILGQSFQQLLSQGGSLLGGQTTSPENPGTGTLPMSALTGQMTGSDPWGLSG